MDRLIKPDTQSIEMFFIKGQKCNQTFKLTNLMHTMPVAVSLTSSYPSIFSFSQPLSIIPPLSTLSFTIQLDNRSDNPPLSAPPNTVLVRSSMLPTGKAPQDDLRRLFSKPGPHIFKDAVLTISFVGSHFAELLLRSPASNSLESDFLLSKAISRCDVSDLTSLLRIAAVNGKSRFVSALIESGADVNDRGSDRDSIMCLAVRSGKTEIVQVLIESGYVIENKIDRFLHDAAAMNRVDLMEILCLGYVNLDLDSVNSHGQTPLHMAAIHGQIEALQFLISVGSEVDATDNDGYTPLHHAAQEGHFGAVEFLLNHSIFAKYALTKDGKTAFALAVEYSHSGLYDVLHLGDSLHRAARINDIRSIKSCLDQGARVNGRDQNGWTPLHRASFKGHLESVKLLVSNGARVDVIDGTGYTPLLRAVEAGHVEVAMYLLSHGAKASLKSLKGIVNCDLGSFKNHPSLLSPLHQEKERV